MECTWLIKCCVRANHPQTHAGGTRSVRATRECMVPRCVCLWRKNILVLTLSHMLRTGSASDDEAPGHTRGTGARVLADRLPCFCLSIPLQTYEVHILCMQGCLYVCTYMLRPHTHIRMCVCMYVYTYMCVCMYVYTYVCICTCFVLTKPPIPS